MQKAMQLKALETLQLITPFENHCTIILLLLQRTNYFKQLKALEPLLHIIHSSFGE
jgi:hypothetical protein